MSLNKKAKQNLRECNGHLWDNLLEMHQLVMSQKLRRGRLSMKGKRIWMTTSIKRDYHKAQRGRLFVKSKRIWMTTSIKRDDHKAQRRRLFVKGKRIWTTTSIGRNGRKILCEITIPLNFSFKFWWINLILHSNKYV